MLVNAVLRHGVTHASDYRPLPRKPFPYDLAEAEALMLALEAPLSA